MKNTLAFVMFFNISDFYKNTKTLKKIDFYLFREIANNVENVRFPYSKHVFNIFIEEHAHRPKLAVLMIACYSM